eukprot:m.124953 g.124953  ORF g.124953 m.124953 type:complete len:236 (-) comp15604_c1_seq6:2585-3292(-)
MGSCHPKELRTIETFSVVYVGSTALPSTAYAGVDACYTALQSLTVSQAQTNSTEGSRALPAEEDDSASDFLQLDEKKTTTNNRSDRIKAVLTVSIYGIKALRTTFAGMKQDDMEEYGNGGVAFDLVVNESIFRIAFCTDLSKTFCFITQNRDTGIMYCHAFECKNVKECKRVAEATAAACAKVYSTINILKEHLTSPQVTSKLSSTPLSSIFVIISSCCFCSFGLLSGVMGYAER